MQQQEFNRMLDAAGIHRIAVVGIPDQSGDLEFDGTLQEFLEALHCDGRKTVLTSSLLVHEGMFFHSPEEDEFDVDESDPVDLCTIDVSLRPYREHIGKPWGFETLAVTSVGRLRYIEPMPWADEFFDKLEAVRDAVDNDWGSVVEARHKRLMLAEKSALASLGKLMLDSSFTSLPTQAAMREYALDRIPELHEVPASKVRAEIQRLSAKLKAQIKGKH